MENKIIVDYLSFSSKIDSTSSVIELLGLQKCSFQLLKGFYGYKDRLYFNGISIHYNGAVNMGICVEMSGQGCRAWEQYGNADYYRLLSLIRENYNPDSSARQMNLKRIDIAFDDFSGVLDLDLLCTETIKKHFVSRWNDFQVIQGNKGCAVNHGSQKSNVYLRIYDKRLEQCREDIDHWVRAELQIRGDCAVGVLQSGCAFETLYFEILNNYLRYIVPGKDSNLSRCLTAPYWAEFLETLEKRSIFFKPADCYTFDKLYAFVTGQCSGAIQTFIDVVGVTQFLEDIHKSRQSKTLNSNYKNIKNTTDSKEDKILQYLREHDPNL